MHAEPRLKRDLSHGRHVLFGLMNSQRIVRSAGLLLSILILLAAPAPALAQESTGDPQAPSGEAQDQDTEAPPPKSPDVRLRVSLRSEGVAQFASGRWGVVGVEATNTTDEAVEIQSVSWFSLEPGLQFGRRIRVPAHSRRRTWYSVLVPKAGKDVKKLDFKSEAFRTEGSGDVFLRGASEEKVETKVVSLSRLPHLAVHLSDTTERELEITPRIREMLGKGPLSNHWLTDLGDPSLPPLAEALQPVETLIVTGDRLARDASGLQAVRSWVSKGGTLWLMADQMAPTTLDVLLHDVTQIDVVDSVELTEFVVQRESATKRANPPMQFDKPVRLMRTIVDGPEVTHVVDGWPAAVRMPFGKGQIVCTMLEIEAWITPWEWWADEQRPPLPTGPSEVHTISSAATDLGRIVFLPPVEPPVTDKALDDYLASRIGYEVPGRAAVLLILGGYCLAVLICGIALARRDKGALGWFFYPGFTLIAVVSLVVIGNQSYSQESRVVTSQVIHVEPGQSELSVTGRMAVWSDAATDGPLAFTEGGRFVPDRGGLKSALWRMVRTDVNEWEANNLKLPPGLRIGEFSHDFPTEEEVRVTGTFDKSGFLGSIARGPLSLPEDATIATRTAFTLPITVAQDGTLSGSESDVLPPGEFLSDGLLTNEQQRRQKLIRTMLSTDGRLQRYPARPMLFAWVEPLKRGMQLPHEKFEGIALAALPIEFERPVPGSHVQIPAPFLDYRSASRSGPGVSAAYKNSLGVWTKNSFKSQASLRFQVPVSLLPFKATRGTLTLKITAPLRDVRVSSGLKEPDVELGKEKGPVGERTYELKSEQALELDEDGGLFVVIDVGDVILESGRKAALGTQDLDWHIDWVRLSLAGDVLPTEP